MTQIELSQPLDNFQAEQLEALSLSRELFQRRISDPNLAEIKFEDVTVNYLNALQDLYFNGSESCFATYSDVATELYKQVGAVFGRICEIPMVDIEATVLEYCSDDCAQSLDEQNLPHLPRAFTLTMLDLINAHRTIVSSKKACHKPKRAYK